MKEIPTIKPGQVYVYQHHGLSEITVIAIKGDYVKLDHGIGWVSKNEFKAKSCQLLGRWKHVMGFKFWRIE